MATLSDMLKQVQGLEEAAGTFLAKLQDFQHALESQLQVQASPPLPFMQGFMIFVLAIFVGYYVVWRVTPALHAPLMSVTNAISSVIIVGALLACGAIVEQSSSQWLGFFGVVLASVNIVGGFLITHRMLGMFRQRTQT